MSEYELQMDIKKRMRMMLENEEKVRDLGIGSSVRRH